MMPTKFLNDSQKLMDTWLAGWPGTNLNMLSLTDHYILPVVNLFILIQRNIQKGMLFTGFHG